MLAAPASAVMRDRRQNANEDSRRYGLDKPQPGWKRPNMSGARALSRLRAMSTAGVRARFSPQGSVTSLSGRLSEPTPGGPEAAARTYLAQNRDLHGIDPASLALDIARTAGGVAHLLFRQRHDGIEVEFARVKMHVSALGEVLGIQSDYAPDLPAASSPAIGVAQAAQAVEASLGRSPGQSGTLVYLPVYKTGEVRLAWRFRVSQQRSIWMYYVDALTGEILFRYNDMRYVCQTSGNVIGKVYDLDTSAALVDRAIPNQYVYTYNAAGPSAAVTDAAGAYCNSNTAGKIYAGLQGPYANVSNYNSFPAHFDNGGGTWFPSGTNVTSPDPYPAGSRVPNSMVAVSTINSPTPPVAAPFIGAKIVAAVPIFQTLDVGLLNSEGEIAQDDQLVVTDGNGVPVASFIGQKSSLRGGMVLGIQPQIGLHLFATPIAGGGHGYQVVNSSFMALTNNPTTLGASSDIAWNATHTSDNSVDEINIFYHLNKMHDFLNSDVNSAGNAPIGVPVVAMAHAGASLANAFYNPDYGNFFFGDAAQFALDATVVRHEYMHFVVDRIFPVFNFGQFGAVSESVADYFSATSLNHSAIGGGVAGAFGSEASLRNLACNHSGGSPACKVYPTDWAGEIHDDSLPLSQSLWDLRTSVGAACTDELVFQSLFYFPYSFEEFLDAMLQVNARAPGVTPQCVGSNATRATSIASAFSGHGISTTTAGGDAFEPNDGPQTATSISTFPTVSATIFPTGDMDYYVFGAAAGLVHTRLELPNQGVGANFAYGMQLLDRNYRPVAQAAPLIDVTHTAAGGCPGGLSDCLTSSTDVDLYYNNPSAGQFYLVVSGAATDEGSNSGTRSTKPYRLTFEYPFYGAIGASIVSASFDGDVISFAATVSTFVRIQDLTFDHAQLRDQAGFALPGTETNTPSPYLVLVSSVSSGGRITGTVRLASGFARRFPSVGTVALEVFARSRLETAQCEQSVHPGAACLSQSLGVSGQFNLTAHESSLTAWNNVFNPRQGQKTTFKYEVKNSGHVTLKLYTQSGAFVATILDQEVTAGKGAVDWYGTNANGRTVASGIYLLNMQGPGISAVQKVVVVK